MASIDPHISIPAWLLNWVTANIAYFLLPMMFKHSKAYAPGGKLRDRLESKPKVPLSRYAPPPFYCPTPPFYPIPAKWPQPGADFHSCTISTGEGLWRDSPPPRPPRVDQICMHLCKWKCWGGIFCCCCCCCCYFNSPTERGGNSTQKATKVYQRKRRPFFWWRRGRAASAHADPRRPRACGDCSESSCEQWHNAWQRRLPATRGGGLVVVRR